MRFIDYTGIKTNKEKGKDLNIRAMGRLTREATKIAEQNRIGLLKNRFGEFRLIRESGLGLYDPWLESLEEVDDFLKNLDKHERDKI